MMQPICNDDLQLTTFFTKTFDDPIDFFGYEFLAMKLWAMHILSYKRFVRICYNENAHVLARVNIHNLDRKVHI